MPFQLQRLSLIPVHHSPRVKMDLLFSQGIHNGLAFSRTVTNTSLLARRMSWRCGLGTQVGFCIQPRRLSFFLL
jgi:hypothetical protein